MISHFCGQRAVQRLRRLKIENPHKDAGSYGLVFSEISMRLESGQALKDVVNAFDVLAMCI